MGIGSNLSLNLRDSFLQHIYEENNEKNDILVMQSYLCGLSKYFKMLLIYTGGRVTLIIALRASPVHCLFLPFVEHADIIDSNFCQCGIPR